MSKLKVKDLREAKYNPRVISEKRLDNLHKSMTTYGDLSGVVFNERTKTLISGHQRLKNLKKAGIKTKIVTSKVSDEFGTVAEGWVVCKTDKGEIRIPFRSVDWSDKKSEMAANIAANSHGGDFDRDKLSVLLGKLAKGKQFDVDLLGLDPLTVRTLMPKLPDVESTSTDSDQGEEPSFAEYDGESFEFEHKCPKCSYKW